MKKVLLGLLALSAVSMAVAPNLGDAATAGTNVFQTGQEGAISITGKITSTIPVVKYVVYASDDNGTTKEDTLILKDFIVSQDDSTAGFTGTNPKMYVKRVGGTTGAETYEALEAGDDVKFKLEVDSFYTGVVPVWTGTGGKIMIEPTGLLSKATLEEIIAASGNSTLMVSSAGSIADSTEAKHYRGKQLIQFDVIANGEIETKNLAQFAPASSTLDSADLAAVERGFAGGKAISNAKILVKVD